MNANIRSIEKLMKTFLYSPDFVSQAETDELVEEITHNITKGLSNNSIAQLASTLDYKTCEGICRDYFGNQYDELPYFKGRK